MCVRESGLRVTITDGAQRLGGRPSLVRAWQHPYSFTYPCRPYLPPLNLLLFLSFLFYYTPPQPPRLLLHMNNAGALLDRCYQHATACFIHAKLRQIPHPTITATTPSSLTRSVSSHRPQRHQRQLAVSARKVSLTPASLQESDPGFSWK